MWAAEIHCRLEVNRFCIHRTRWVKSPWWVGFPQWPASCHFPLCLTVFWNLYRYRPEQSTLGSLHTGCGAPAVHTPARHSRTLGTQMPVHSFLATFCGASENLQCYKWTPDYTQRGRWGNSGTRHHQQEILFLESKMARLYMFSMGQNVIHF